MVYLGFSINLNFRHPWGVTCTVVLNIVPDWALQLILENTFSGNFSRPSLNWEAGLKRACGERRGGMRTGVMNFRRLASISPYV